MSLCLVVMLAACSNKDQSADEMERPSSTTRLAAESTQTLPELPTIPLDGLKGSTTEHIQLSIREVQGSPADATKNGQLAMVLHSYDLLDGASVVYQRARLLAPGKFDWHYLHGVVLQKLAQTDAAQEAYSDASAILANYAPLQLRLARSAASNSDVATAIDHYKQVLSSQPTLAVAQFELGQILRRDGNNEAAMAAFESALDLEPDYSAARFALATVWRELGANNKAQEQLALFEASDRNRQYQVSDPVLARVVELNVSQSKVFNRALALVQQRRLSEAVREFERVLEENPENYGAHINLIGLYGDLGKPTQAERHYEQALVLASDRPVLYNNIGTVRLRYGRVTKAVSAFAKAVELDPSYTRAWRNLGKAQFDAGKRSEAEVSLLKSIALDDTDRQTHYFLAEAYLRRGEATLAIESLRACLEPEDERTPLYMQVLAKAHAQAGDVEQALLVLEDAKKKASAMSQAELVSELEVDLAKLRERLGGGSP